MCYPLFERVVPGAVNFHLTLNQNVMQLNQYNVVLKRRKIVFIIFWKAMGAFVSPNVIVLNLLVEYQPCTVLQAVLGLSWE